MKSYYISSINLWVLGVCGVVSQDTKEKIRTEFKKQVSTAKDVVVLDECIAPLTVVESLKNSKINLKKLCSRNETIKDHTPAP